MTYIVSPELAVSRLRVSDSSMILFACSGFGRVAPRYHWWTAPQVMLSSRARFARPNSSTHRVNFSAAFMVVVSLVCPWSRAVGAESEESSPGNIRQSNKSPAKMVVVLRTELTSPLGRSSSRRRSFALQYLVGCARESRRIPTRERLPRRAG